MKKYDIFLICPVRNATDDQKALMEAYITSLEHQGKKVYYPNRDTNQVDPIGYRICKDNKKAIKQSKEIHIFWDKDSQGSLFDLGMAFAMGKPLTIVNLENLQPTPTKSFVNMVLCWGSK
jgi:hypothetical protein